MDTGFKACSGIAITPTEQNILQLGYGAQYCVKFEKPWLKVSTGDTSLGGTFNTKFECCSNQWCSPIRALLSRKACMSQDGIPTIRILGYRQFWTCECHWWYFSVWLELYPKVIVFSERCDEVDCASMNIKGYLDTTLTVSHSSPSFFWSLVLDKNFLLVRSGPGNNVSRTWWSTCTNPSDTLCELWN